jgi:hypothetical protein
MAVEQRGQFGNVLGTVTQTLDDAQPLRVGADAQEARTTFRLQLGKLTRFTGAR